MAVLCVVALARFRTYLRSLYIRFTRNYLQDYTHTTTQVPCRVTACLLLIQPFYVLSTSHARFVSPTL